MNRFLNNLLIILVTALVVGGGMYYFLSGKNDDQAVNNLPEDESQIEEDQINTYSDDYLSFDYPADIELLVSGFGEGSHGEVITFISRSKETGVFGNVGPMLYLSNEGDWSDEGLVEKAYEENMDEDSEELEFKGMEAYLKQVVNDFSGEKYSEVHFLTQRESSDGTKSDYYGYFKPESPMGKGSRYEEILDLFINSASH